MCINVYVYMYLNAYAYMCEVKIEMNFQQNKKTKKVPKPIASFNEDIVLPIRIGIWWKCC